MMYQDYSPTSATAYAGTSSGSITASQGADPPPTPPSYLHKPHLIPSPPTNFHRYQRHRGRDGGNSARPSAGRFFVIFTLLEAGPNTTPQARLELIVTLPLGERSSLVVCLEAPEPHIRFLWVTQLITPSFVIPTPEDVQVIAFSQDIWMDQLPASVVIQPEWITPREVEVQREADMGAALARLAPGHPRLAADTTSPEIVSVPLASPASLFLVHALIVSLFLSPSNKWHMMYANANAKDISQRLISFIEWFREATVDPQQGVNSLSSVDLEDTKLEQRQGIRTSLAPPPSTTTKPRVSAPAILISSNSSIPTARTNQEADVYRQDIGGRPPEPPPDVQLQ